MSKMKDSMVIIPHEKGTIVGWLFENQEMGVNTVTVVSDMLDRLANLCDTPCGECHLQPGEVCDICGKQAA